VQPPPLSILGLTFYNPYASGKANSQRFFEWQFGRATEALHGRRYSVAEYLEESFETALPHVTDQPGYDILALAAFLCGSLFATFLNEVALSHSLRRATSVSRYRLLTIAAPFGIPLLVDVYYLFTHSTSVSMPVVRMLLLRVSALLPQNLPAVAAIAIVPALAMYCLLEWQFAQSEITGPMSPALAHLSAGGHR
jgi:hypothetical protein